MTDVSLNACASLAAHQLGEAVCMVKASAAVLGQTDPAVIQGLAGGAERVQRFVDDLLDVMDTDSADLDVERVELDDALAAAAGVLASDLAAAGAQLEAEPMPAAFGSRVLLERLFVHLLRNALAARAACPLVISVEARPADDAVAVAVRDTGRELDPDAVTTAFEPFSRGRGRGPLVGAGVGMAMCRTVVQRHGGTIAAERLPDGRTGIEFTLPRAAA